VVVVDVLRRPLLADQAEPSLSLEPRIDFGRAHAITTLQVVVPSAAIQSLERFLSSGIVAGLAIAPKPVRLSL
jgi:hypothetical protein